MDISHIGAIIKGQDVLGQVKAIEAITGSVPKCFQIFTHDTKNNAYDLPDEEGIKELIKTSRCHIHSTFGVSMVHPYTAKRFSDQYKVASELGAASIVLHIPSYELGDEIETRMYQGARRYFAEAAKVVGHHPIIYFEHVMSKTHATPMYLLQLVRKMEAIAGGYSNKLRVGICIDTCHLYASGQTISTGTECKSYFDQFNGCGLPILIHLNDSIGDFGSLIDRHAELGTKIWNGGDGLRHIIGLGHDCIIELKDPLPSYRFLMNGCPERAIPGNKIHVQEQDECVNQCDEHGQNAKVHLISSHILI
jgi:endonuclease IV